MLTVARNRNRNAIFYYFHFVPGLCAPPSLTVARIRNRDALLMSQPTNHIVDDHHWSAFLLLFTLLNYHSSFVHLFHFPSHHPRRHIHYNRLSNLGNRLSWTGRSSPLEWRRFAQARHEPVSVEWCDVFDGVCGILITMLIYGPVIIFLRNSLLPLSTIGPNESVPSALPNLLYPYLCCPWTLHCVYRATKPAVQLTLSLA